jgi:acetyl esterase/lipase
MKLKTSHAIAIGVILSVAAVVVALAGSGALNLRERSITGPTPTPEPTETPPSNSANPTPSPSSSPTQTPETPESPTPTPNSPTPIPAETYTNVSYGNDPAQKFDIYIPESTATRLPLIIFVHGGAWIAGDKSDVTAIAKFLANQGFVVINMNYRLLPTFSYSAPLEDFQMVLQWVHQNSGQYRIDVTRIGMSGHSAGGHLIALYALTQDKNYIAGGSALPRVYAIAPLAGGYTLEGINITDPRRNDTIMEWLRTAEPQSLGLPIYQIDSNDNATFLLLHGAQDVNSPPQQSISFYQDLVAEGVPAKLKIYPGRDHLTLVSGIPSNDQVAKDLVSFFNEKLK